MKYHESSGSWWHWTVPDIVRSGRADVLVEVEIRSRLFQFVWALIISLNLEDLGQSSLFKTRPSLYQTTAERNELFHREQHKASALKLPQTQNPNFSSPFLAHFLLLRIQKSCNFKSQWQQRIQGPQCAHSSCDSSELGRDFKCKATMRQITWRAKKKRRRSSYIAFSQCIVWFISLKSQTAGWQTCVSAFWVKDM